ncbi:Nif3-like dinuclear metal center hexameric protein [Thalassotalea fusca]
MKLSVFERELNALLSPNRIKDFCPNGLQIEGKGTINKVVTGVTATQSLIEAAIAREADALVVHHGYFWKNESYVIRGMKYQRIKALIDNGISLFAYHLPLDIHEELGNNVQLARRLNIGDINPLEIGNELCVSLQGSFAKALTGDELKTKIDSVLARECLHIAPPSNKSIKTVAWCTGGGQGYIDLAAEQGIDAFITGEASEQTTHVAREMDIHFFAAGHHATERYGAMALAEYINENLGVSAEFVDIDNPV